MKTVVAYNGEKGLVSRMLTMEASLGPSRERKITTFLVVPDITVPILGLQAINTFKLLIDGLGRRLVNRETKAYILCSSVQGTGSKNA